MDAQQQRLERLRASREKLASLEAAGMPRVPEELRLVEEISGLEQEIAEAEEQSLTGSGAPRTDTRLEGERATRYVAAMMSHGPLGVSARRLRADAVSASRVALTRLRLACRYVRSALAPHASVSGPRRPGRVRAGTGRARRGPARAAPARPRRAGAA